MTILEAVLAIKKLIEDSILQGGTTAKNNLIRSSAPINLIHEAVKYSLIDNGVSPKYIKPALNETTGELPLYGFLKKKNQDIAVIPKDIKPKSERVILGQTDKFGEAFTTRVLSINVRSQLSSAAKNFDTLYERTFAEASNLHGRCPLMVLGEVYMIAIREYDISASDRNLVKFKPLDSNISNHVEKYLLYFEMLNRRNSAEGQDYKYERVSLVLVDFSTDVPKIYNTKEELIHDGLLDSQSIATIENLTFDSLVPSLLLRYQERFGKPSFIE